MIDVAVAALVATGLTGRTDLLVPWTPSARFVRLDRRYDGPLCPMLALGASVSLRG